MGQGADERNKPYLCELSSIFFHFYLKLIVFMFRLKAHGDDSSAFRGYAAIFGQGVKIISDP